MPKIAKELSALEVSNKSGVPGFYRVGGVNGLALNVKKSLAASWILRVVVGEKRKDIGLGSYPTVTLAIAREKARVKLREIDEGKDPVKLKKDARRRLIVAQQKETSFSQAATRYHRTKLDPELSSKRHSTNWLRSLELHVFPKIGNVLVEEIDTKPHIMDVLEPIWHSKTDTAKRVRQRIEAVLDWASVEKMREGPNPARWEGHLEMLLSRPSKIAKVKHHAALPWEELPEFMAQLRNREGMGARALEFIALTAARSGEVRLAPWPEVNLEKALWTIPEERMKANKKHRVPLNRPAVDLLRMLEGEGDYLFTAARGGPLSDMSISAVCRRMKVPAVPHGFRSTFKDWCRANTSYQDEISELALAHVNSDSTRAAYARDDLLDVRRRLMDEWGDFCGV